MLNITFENEYRIWVFVILKTYSSLRNANVSSVFGAEKIDINENLTARRAGLFRKVRDQKRLHQEWKIWTVDGNIFIKPSPSSRTSKINSLDDLNSLYWLQYISISL